MTESQEQTTQSTAQDFTKTWRYKLGLFMIIVGNLGIVVALFLPLLGFSAGTVGALVLGGEVVSLASIVFLGKEGFKAIKSKAFAFVKAGYAVAVGRTRHAIGMVLFCASVLGNYIMAVYAWTAFDRVTPDDPLPAIWGLEFVQQGSLLFWVFLISELSFLISIYVLGADWWGKFRRIFVWKESEQ